MIVVCSVCGRHREKSVQGKGTSHGYCARCAVLQYAADLHDTPEEIRNDLKRQLTEERRNGIVWEGEDTAIFSQELFNLYNETFLEVESERGEGSRK